MQLPKIEIRKNPQSDAALLEPRLGPLITAYFEFLKRAAIVAALTVVGESIPFVKALSWVSGLFLVMSVTLMVNKYELGFVIRAGASPRMLKVAFWVATLFNLVIGLSLLIGLNYVSLTLVDAWA
ncbi:hypothetical protein [Phenylobacterium sp.]|uniref:hypothetical protein n=1 Tax=Phenylobacterium sp. TaxID=1871053 RepID=UPI00272EED7E|nr:hypothetical protein [Phenylobacterium sp.]MDP1598729.1 hypothetical protein [Phenylobacterium sp.]